MLQITQRRQEGTLIAVYTGELDHHAARAAIEPVSYTHLTLPTKLEV